MRTLTLLAPLALTACATVSSIQQVPLSAGRTYGYAAPPESVAVAGRRVLSAANTPVATEQTLPDSSLMLVGKRGITLFGWGELARLVVLPDTGGGSTVSIITRSVNQFDILRADRSPRLFASLDRELPAGSIRLDSGVRLRITTAEGSRTGPLGPDLQLSAAVRKIEISRGSYGHAKELALVGTLIGGVVGYATSSSVSGPLEGLDRFNHAMVGALVGFVGGGLLGSFIRTEVWSLVR